MCQFSILESTTHLQSSVWLEGHIRLNYEATDYRIQTFFFYYTPEVVNSTTCFGETQVSRPNLARFSVLPSRKRLQQQKWDPGESVDHLVGQKTWAGFQPLRPVSLPKGLSKNQTMRSEELPAGPVLGHR